MATKNADGSIDCDGDAAVAATRATLDNALKSVDNLTELLTMLCRKEERHAVVCELLFTKDKSGNPGFRIYITADNDLDEVALAKEVLRGVEGALAHAARATNG